MWNSLTSPGMKTNLLEALAGLPDFRAPRGKRYPLWLILLLVIMATMSDCYGYRALEDFARRHHQALLESLELPPMGFPSDSTFRRVMMSIDFTQLAQVLTNWIRDGMPTQEGDWLGVDGKSIKGTVNNYAQAYQDFVSIVSVFSSRCGVAIALEQFRNKESSEIDVVQLLLANLGLTGAVFTFDALHCQKKLSS
ncbi:MAG: ISAs1 family transposase [Symploca sp. SIO1B1]|nr:ISAs1 family transposase [Symploca sp. SIO1B1]